MDYPFRGDLSVKPVAFELVLENIQQLMAEEKAGLIR
jgi:hypothetical protein